MALRRFVVCCATGGVIVQLPELVDKFATVVPVVAAQRHAPARQSRNHQQRGIAFAIPVRWRDSRRDDQAGAISISTCPRYASCAGRPTPFLYSRAAGSVVD